MSFLTGKKETYSTSVLHLNLISVVDGSTLNWCVQNILQEALSKYMPFERVFEPKMRTINFNNRFRDRMAELERGRIEQYAKL